MLKKQACVATNEDELSICNKTPSAFPPHQMFIPLYVPFLTNTKSRLYDRNITSIKLHTFTGGFNTRIYIK